MTDTEYSKIIRALDLARERLARQGVPLDEADQRIRSLVNLAVRTEARMPPPFERAGVLPGIGTRGYRPKDATAPGPQLQIVQ